MRLALIAAVALALSACDDTPKTQPQPPSQVSAWEVGPVIKGRNKSTGVPLHPSPYEGALFAFDLPQPPGSAHYVTYPSGSLAGKSQIRMTYRLEGAEGAEVHPPSEPLAPAMLTLHFQRCDDDWSAKGKKEAYRWYASFATVIPLVPVAEQTVTASLTDPRWSAVLTSTAATNPTGFAEAKANACRLGFVLGGGDGLGHGVFATGPMKLIVTEFTVE